jgi:peptidoglycan-associated lipoprotein
MSKKFWIILTLLVVIPGLLFTVSCAKKVVQSEPAAEEQPEAVVEEQKETEADMAKKAEEEQAAQEEAAKKLQEQAEEELRQQQLAEQAAKEEEMQRVKAAAMQMFMSEDVYFDFDSSALGGIAKEVLSRKADWLRENSDALVIVEGHCDERGTNAYNIALGDRRAESAKTYLVDLGIDANRLTTISYGEERPVDIGSNEEAWAKNRRVHFVVE